MSRKISVKCAIGGCHRRLKMTPEEREELRRIGREHNATAGIVCPKDVKAAFNFEYDDIDVDVPLEEYLNQSHGGMCIRHGLGRGPGIPQ